MSLISDSPSPRIHARGRRAPAFRPGPKQLAFQTISIHDRKNTRASSVGDRLAHEIVPKVAGVRVTNGPGRCRDGHPFNALDIARREVPVVDDQPFGHLAADANGGRQRHVDTRRANVRQLVDGQGGLMGDHADDIGPADLGPENGLHVVAEPGHREPGETVHTARHALDVPLLGELDETHLMMAAPIATTAAAVVPGVPVALFPTRVWGGGIDAQQARQYDVAPDGRFLINTVIESAAAPITLIQNWRPEGKQ